MNLAHATNAVRIGPKSMLSSKTKSKIDFSRFDHSSRKPRAVQEQFLTWLVDNWNEADFFAGQLTVASGKSALARTIQLATGGHVITPSNILVDQYCETYPTANYLIGKRRYTCFSGLPCATWVDDLEQKPCHNCPYQKCRERAKKEPTFFNPISLHYFNLSRKSSKDVVKSPVLIIDEAHQLPQMLLMLAGKKFRRSLYKFKDSATNEVHLEAWLVDQIRKLDKLAQLYRNTGDMAKLLAIADELTSTGLVLQGLRDEPENYVVYLENGTYRHRKEVFLNVRPIRPPKNIVRDLLDSGKIILLSGTLFPSDIEDLAVGRTVRFVDLPSPIPKERRPILYRPAHFAMNVETDPRLIVLWIEAQLRAFPGRNTIIHTTYSQSAKLLPHFNRPILHNSSENKNEVVERFKREGGIFLAAGCAEGLDLKDDLCRLNLIPSLQRPNLGDPVVSKRRALEGGDEWYELESLRLCVQQSGRSTRHEKDESITVVGDPLFSRLVAKRKARLPQSFTEAIRWAGH